MTNAIKQSFHFGRFFFSLKGRLTRAPFIAFMLPMKLLSTAILTAKYISLPLIPAFALGLIALQLVLAWPQYAIIVKRLHDIGRSALFAIHIPVYMIAWLYYLFFFYYLSHLQPLNLLPYVAYNLLEKIVVFYGYVLFFVLAFVPGTKGMNLYGPHPRHTAQSISNVF
jgi:uncharacterized membrane protein YhaH (DUF805 family)